MNEYDLTLDKDGNPATRDVIIVAVLLLVKVAEDENGISSEELTHIAGSIARKFNWKDEDIGEAISVAQFLLKDKQKSDSIISRINDKFNVQQKQQILAMAWRVIVADDKLTQSEANFSIELRKKLGLSLEQATYARALAEEEILEIKQSKQVQEPEPEE